MTKAYTFSKLGYYGALGNQLWQIAGTVGEALTNKGMAFFPSWEYDKYFSCPPEFFSTPSDTEVHDFYPDYMQDLKHFEEYSQDIRRIFRPSELSAKKIDTMFDDFYLPIIAVHVRRANNMFLPDHHPVPPLEYFEAALDQMPTNKCHVLVFSDDMDWCKQQTVFKDAHFGLGVPQGIDIMQLTGDKPLVTEEAAIDLLAIANCHYHVISNSSFSWWGAWLANSRKVIYPAKWYGKELEGIDTSVMFPKEWIRLDV